MSSTMLAPSQAGPGRISQLLPTVKCSACHQPVPLTELGEHTCSSPPQLAKPSVSQEGVNSLLPPRLQGRLGAPPPPRGPPPQRGGSALSDRPRPSASSAGPATAPFHPRSSPLARGQGEPTDLSDPFRRPPPVSADPRTRNNSMSSNYSSPIPPRSVGPPPPAEQTRYHTGTPRIPNQPSGGLPISSRPPPPGRPSLSGMPPVNRNASPAPSQLSINRNQPSPAPSMNRNGPPPQMRGPPPQGPSMAPPPPRPGPPPHGPPPMAPPTRAVPFPSGTPPPNMMGPRPPISHGPQRSYAPAPPSGPGYVMASSMPYGTPVPEGDIDTRSGGEAGMAGVGRKGFAAVARAAMFATPQMRPQGPQRRPDVPRFLDIDAASRSTDTPPLSAGSGYSSHSPGPTSPLAQAQFPPSHPADNMPKSLPTPPRIDTSVSNPSLDKTKTPVGAAHMAATNTPISPFSIRLPFFEKLKNMVPGSNSPVETTPTAAQPQHSLQKDFNHTERSTPTPTPLTPRPTPPLSDSTNHSRSISKSSESQYTRDYDRTPASPTGSDYSGLAYEASTDNGEDSPSRSSLKSDHSDRGRKLPSVPPLRLNGGGASANTRVHFTSSSRSDAVPIAGGHSRATSSSSYSSASSVDSRSRPRQRTNSSVIAQALGLSQTPPRDYSKLGGPGVPSRTSRIGRSTSISSIGSRGAYSRTASVVTANAPPSAFDMLERTMMKKGGEHEREGEDEWKKLKTASELVKSKPLAILGSVRQRSNAGSSGSGSARGTDYGASERGSMTGSSTGSRTQRSNTVQGVLSSGDLKAPKLPMRAKTTTTVDTSGGASGEALARAKERRKKEKACVKCRKVIDDGRWIQVDTGSILCERCWKHMYLPKCRRCNLPIEKQAVSSSDGQLKGKYHKECFNCHTCHKPFPDKTFYVFDGKPFCAYHYHEVNESLCAAARCGQPIEGPCAVSHAGDRYHPDCMTCEYPGYPACRDVLKEYFEVDGRMLCERHALSGGGSDEEDEWARSTKATRRVTRFIDLAGGGPGLGNNSNNGGNADDSGLR